MTDEPAPTALPLPPGAVNGVLGRTELVLLAAVGFGIVFKFLLIFRLNVHWDEYYFLSFVHDYLRGTLAFRFQTFHVHLFSWLARLGTDEISQVVAARVVMAALATATALLIYGIARRFVAREAALFGVLAYLSLSVVVQNGTSFRADPIATFLVLLALFVLLRWPGAWIGAVLAGIAMALAALVTIKTAFYLPVIAGIIWCMSIILVHRIKLAAIVAAALALTFGILYLVHAASLSAQPPVTAGTYLGGAASKVLFEDGIFPRWADFIIAFGQNPIFWIMAAVGARLAWRKARNTGNREAWLPLLLALPALTPLIYRNAFGYYFVFALPTTAILIALCYANQRQRATTETTGRAARIIVGLITFYCVVLGFNAVWNLFERITPQRTVLAAVHRIFPQPVPYIDGFGVVATFPWHGFFMSTWGMQTYQQAATPYYPNVVSRAHPPLLLADSPSLYGALYPDVTVVEQRRLLPDDVRFLRDNYVQHWGMIFVAGKTLSPPAAGARAEFEIAIPGNYRLEAAAPIIIDDGLVRPGEIVALGSGGHRYKAEGTAQAAVLRWADAKDPPGDAPVDLLTFFGVQR